jgi:hypothetical protein
VFDQASLIMLASMCEMLSELPDMCQASTITAVLPPVLVLMTSALEFICKSVTTDQGHLCVPLQNNLLKIIRSFSKVFKNSHTEDGIIRDDLKKLFQSGLVTILRISKECPKFVANTAQEAGIVKSGSRSSRSSVSRLSKTLGNPLEIVWINLTDLISSFIANSFACSEGDANDLIANAMEIFTSCLETGSIKIRLHAVNLIDNLIRHPVKNIAHPVIQLGVPKLYEMLQQAISTPPANDMEVSILKQAVSILEYLMELADSAKRGGIMSAYAPVLVSLLLDQSSISQATNNSRAFHEFCLQQLTAVGPKYAQDFKLAMQQEADKHGGIR